MVEKRTDGFTTENTHLVASWKLGNFSAIQHTVRHSVQCLFQLSKAANASDSSQQAPKTVCSLVTASEEPSAQLQLKRPFVMSTAP